MWKRQTQAFISKIVDLEGNTYSKPPGIAAAFVSHFEKILAPTIENHHPKLTHVTPHASVTAVDAHAFETSHSV